MPLPTRLWGILKRRKCGVWLTAALAANGLLGYNAHMLTALFLFALHGPLRAKEAPPAFSTREVERVLESLRKAKSIEAQVEKTVEQELLGSKKTSHGIFYFSKGKLRLEITDPDQSVLVYDGKTVWVEDRLDESTVNVSKIKSVQLKKTDSLLAALFDGKKNVLKSFKAVKMKNSSEGKVFTFKPKDKKTTDVTWLEVTVKDRALAGVSYKDAMENTVTLNFKDFKEGSVPDSKFSYQPPKGASVSVF